LLALLIAVGLAIFYADCRRWDAVIGRYRRYAGHHLFGRLFAMLFSTTLTGVSPIGDLCFLVFTGVLWWSADPQIVVVLLVFAWACG